MEIKQIKETSLYVHDLELIKWFYGEKMGFSLLAFEENNHAFFRVGASVLLCFVPEASEKQKEPPPHFGGGNQHIAFEVAADDYLKWQEQLKAKNIEIIREQTWKYGLKSFYFNDPEGNVLEIVPEGLWD